MKGKFERVISSSSRSRLSSLPAKKRQRSGDQHAARPPSATTQWLAAVLDKGTQKTKRRNTAGSHELSKRNQLKGIPCSIKDAIQGPAQNKSASLAKPDMSRRSIKISDGVTLPQRIPKLQMTHVKKMRKSQSTQIGKRNPTDLLNAVVLHKPSLERPDIPQVMLRERPTNTKCDRARPVPKSASQPLSLSLPADTKKRKRKLSLSKSQQTVNDISESTGIGSAAAENIANIGDLLRFEQRMEKTNSHRSGDRLCAFPLLTQSNPAEPAIDAKSGTSPLMRNPTKKQLKVNNDNFVRLNLRNNAGACRGAKNKTSRIKRFERYTKSPSTKRTAETRNYSESDSEDDSATRSRFVQTSHESSRSEVDPLDDFLDGTYRTNSEMKVCGTKSSTAPPTNQVPCCGRHQRPCKLRTVKKSSSGNKGRKFYVCSLPRGEQCDHFEWADNTLHAAQQALLKRSNHSGFVARQVAGHISRFQSLTVPELRSEAKKRQLNHRGKRQELLLRISLWIRDEVALIKKRDAPKELRTFEEAMSVLTKELETVIQSHQDATDNKEDSDDIDSNDSDEELVIFSEEERLSPSTQFMFQCESEVSNREQIEATGAHCKETDSSEFEYSSMSKQLQELFGFESFRDSQDWAVRRCLQKQRTLLVAPTGFGKSLCYALPAAMMEGTCIVVSPLISLIEDQLRQLPPRIPAATLSGGMSASELASVMDDVVKQRIKLLFVSPERLASPSFQRLFRYRWNNEKQLRERPFPPVSLFCVDEAHCLSQWGHNFRPSYLRIRSLMENIQPQSVLAITATACPRVIEDLCKSLKIDKSPEQQAVKVLGSNRDNIDIVCNLVPTEEARIRKLIKLLQATERSDKVPVDALHDGRLANGNVVVYVWRQRDADAVGENLSSSGIEGGVVVYHGGMDAGARKRSQSLFLRGKARICVATVAFGLGINKADIDAVVHLNLPSSPEHYLQEIGRAGRDGRNAIAIAFITQDEVTVRHSLAYTDLLSRCQVRAILHTLRKRATRVRTLIPVDEGTEVPFRAAVPLIHCGEAADAKAETIETLISLMEDGDPAQSLIHVEGKLRDTATVIMKRQSLQKLADKEPIAAAILSCANRLDKPETAEASDLAHASYAVVAYSFGSFRFSVTECAIALGPSAEPRHVFASLRRLQDEGELELTLDTLSTSLQVYVHAHALSQMNKDEELDILVDNLTTRFSKHICANACKVQDIKQILEEVSKVDTVENAAHSKTTEKKSKRLIRFQDLVSEYLGEGKFSSSSRMTESKEWNESRSLELENDYSFALSELLQVESQLPSSAKGDEPVARVSVTDEASDYANLAAAKFLHGLPTIRTGSSAFRQHPLYGKWRPTPFLDVLKIIQTRDTKLK